MSDIVERLRDKWRHSEENCYEAADEIERLRKALLRVAEHDLQAIAIDALEYRRRNVRERSSVDGKMLLTFERSAATGGERE